MLEIPGIKDIEQQQVKLLPVPEIAYSAPVDAALSQMIVFQSVPPALQ